MSTTGVARLLYKFDYYDGDQPLAGMVLATDGNFYGTTAYGSNISQGCFVSGCGTVFKTTPTGKLTTLYSFCPQPGCYDGSSPASNLVEGLDGSLYGTTTSFPYGSGTVFKITQGGLLTTIHTFGSSDGAYPDQLILATDGNFYGTADQGGTNAYGTVFKVTPTGTLTVLYTFCSLPNCTDGANPDAIVQGADGNFYGTAQHGGSTTGKFCYPYGCGTAFKLTPDGVFTILYTFCSMASCTDGYIPSGLMQATDGNLYGTAWAGGANDGGTIFQLTPQGTLTTLHNFDFSDGASPVGLLLQDTNGSFYGTTYLGGEQNHLNGYGTAFSLDMGLGPFVSFVRSYAAVGKMAGILGQGFTGTTGVSFDGIPATFTVRRDTFLTATVQQAQRPATSP